MEDKNKVNNSPALKKADIADPKKTEQAKNLPATQKDVADIILSKVKSLQEAGEINFPANYSPGNALKSAWLVLQSVKTKDGKLALDVCTKPSVINALLDMTIQGLNPIKKQCYFIPYGDQLTLSRSYLGTVAVTKRLKGVKEVFANIIYEDDVFAYHINLATGKKEIDKHDQSFENIDLAKIKGAYAIVKFDDGRPDEVEVMNIAQIRKAWNQGAAKGGSPAHQNFPDEMSKKTAINRACKLLFNTSDDSDVLIQAIHNTRDLDELPEADYDLDVQGEIAQNANQTEIDIKELPESKPEPEVIPQTRREPVKEPVNSGNGKAQPTLTGPGF